VIVVKHVAKQQEALRADLRPGLKGRDVMRPFGPHDNHRPLVVMLSAPPEGGSTIIDAKRRDVERPFGGCKTIKKTQRNKKFFKIFFRFCFF
jgi:hypothetical protein